MLQQMMCKIEHGNYEHSMPLPCILRDNLLPFGDMFGLKAA